jgi:hypothetical protein
MHLPLDRNKFLVSSHLLHASGVAPVQVKQNTSHSKLKIV